MSMEFIRARSKEQKNIRIDHVVKAALKLYRIMPYEKINMLKIAKELDFTRANLYKYFSTKHEVFLKVIESDLRNYIKDLGKVFKDPLPLEKFARMWAEVLFKHKRLLGLLSILFSIIEKNVTLDKLAEFKIVLFRETAKTLQIVKNQFPEFSDEDVNRFLLTQQIFALGLYPATLQNEIQKKAVAKAGISYSPPDFVDAFSQFIVLTVKGLGV